MLSLLTPLLALPLALSAPLMTSRQTTGGGAFQLTSLSSSASFLNNVPLAASGGGFYIGVPTNAPCTLPAPQCAQYSNTTAIVVDSLSSEAGMYSSVPQRVYVAQDGQFSYLEPGQGDQFPDGAYTTPFDGEGDRLRFSGGNSPGWIACPLFNPGQLPYQVLALVSSQGAVCADAVDIEIQTSFATQVGAYEYE